MPPKKKTRLTPSANSPAEPSTPTASSPTATAPETALFSPASELPDDWTPSQKAALFKALIQFKPTGMHKHFRMLSIAEYLRSSGHFGAGTRIPQVWEKLSKIYDLAALDEREDNHWLLVETQSADGPKIITPAKKKKRLQNNESDLDVHYLKDFALPEYPDRDENGFTGLIWHKRLASESERSSSPPQVPELLEAMDGKLRAADQESEAPSTRTTVSRRGRGGRGASRGGRGGRGMGSRGRGRPSRGPAREEQSVKTEEDEATADASPEEQEEEGSGSDTEDENNDTESDEGTQDGGDEEEEDSKPSVTRRRTRGAAGKPQARTPRAGRQVEGASTRKRGRNK